MHFYYIYDNNEQKAQYLLLNKHFSAKMCDIFLLTFLKNMSIIYVPNKILWGRKGFDGDFEV